MYNFAIPVDQCYNFNIVTIIVQLMQFHLYIVTTLIIRTMIVQLL